jgi:hypothetical protein
MVRRFKVFVMSTMALLVVAAGSAAAAGAAPHWTVEGKAFGGTEALNKSVVLEKIAGQTTPTLNLRTPGHYGVNCSTASIEGSITQTSLISSLGMTLKGCVVVGPRNEATSCQVWSPGQQRGVLRIVEAKSELRTIGSSTDLLITMPNMNRLMFSECIGEGQVPWSGTAVFEVQTGTSGTYLSVESSNAIQGLSHLAMFAGGSNSYFEGKAKLSLASGKSWGVGL